MKYLKKFNEELKPGTYLSAARKLKKLGHLDRAQKLTDWADMAEKQESLIKWKDALQDYALFGTYKLNIVSPKTGVKYVGDFYLDINFDELAFEDSYEYEKENSDEIKDQGLLFFIGIIPTSEEGIKRCEEIMPAAEFGNGFYWGMTAELKYDIVGKSVKLTNFILDNYDTSLSGKVSFADRPSAGKFKKLMVDIFSKPELNYPSGYGDVEWMYQKLEQVILIRQSFSSDWGFTLEDAAKFISTISPNELYKTV
jgi:hypothetical protein